MIKLFVPRRPQQRQDTQPRPEVLLLQQRIAEQEGHIKSFEAANQMYSDENVLLRNAYNAIYAHTEELMRCQSILKARQLHQAWKAFREEHITEAMNDISETPDVQQTL